MDLNAASIVSQSGDWSSGSTWSDGVVPETSSANPLDSLSFETSGLTLRVDGSSYYVSLIELGNNAESTIDIAENQTFYIRNLVGDNPFITSNSKDNILNINGGEISRSISEWANSIAGRNIKSECRIVFSKHLRRGVFRGDC
ncbi:MAG: hypothetical protein ACLUKN_03615 [Bacilli bacterium]